MIEWALQHYIHTFILLLALIVVVDNIAANWAKVRYLKNKSIIRSKGHERTQSAEWITRYNSEKNNFHKANKENGILRQRVGELEKELQLSADGGSK
ncbi:hypothetical protein ACFQZR_14995 [Paenibacillus sp. GCM10027629]|uniref:hypothetical protein n=1 Tax=Paenibacillus sp. GCM10027629 TaxID=3273414 RepID=UPI0036262621